MSATRYASVLDLGFGDSGKGLFVDALTRRWHVHTVVRFSGGAQAGHNVVTSSQHHTFSQFGAGTLVSGTRTVLLDPFVLHPTALLVEAEALARGGVQDGLPRLLIDARCRVNTPFHQAAGRLRELLRGADAHGTCGVGVGETVRQSLVHPGHTIRYADLLLPEAAVLEKLHAQREALLAELRAGRCAELAVLQDDSLARRWLRTARALARQCPPTAVESLNGLLISHLDAFERGISLKWCAGYQTTPKLPLGTLGDLEYQTRLTRLLHEASPNYLETQMTCETDFLDQLASVTSLPIKMRSFGNTAEHVHGVP